MPSLESLAHWVGVCAAVFTALGAGAGVLAFVLSFRVSQARDEVFLRYQTESTLKIEDARTAGARANAEAATANERAATHEKESAELKDRTAHAELRLAEIKEREGDRKFTDEQFLKVTQMLSLGGKENYPSVQLMFVDQGEPKRFAELLLTVFRAAGWDAEIVKWNRAGMLIPGVFVESRKGDTAANGAGRNVAQQFQNVGVPAMSGEAVDDSTFLPNSLIIRVGPRVR